MTTGRSVRVAALLAGLACTGCVDRRFVIESNVPNAQVYIDDRPIGAAPAHTPFEYYGTYTVKLVHPGYETRIERVHVTAPWYGYPPFDFLAEVLYPGYIRDTRRYCFDLREAVQLDRETLLNDAEALRQRGWSLPQAERPAPPKPVTPRQPVPQPLPPQVPGPQLPAPQPLPPPTPNPLVPGVGPQG